MKAYKCVNCEILYNSEQDQKNHYQSEIHTYNTQRRSLNLAPVRPEEFEQIQKSILRRRFEQIKAA